jgi:hypothetical protein
MRTSSHTSDPTRKIPAPARPKTTAPTNAKSPLLKQTMSWLEHEDDPEAKPSTPQMTAPPPPRTRRAQSPTRAQPGASASDGIAICGRDAILASCSRAATNSARRDSCLGSTRGSNPLAKSSIVRIASGPPRASARLRGRACQFMCGTPLGLTLRSNPRNTSIASRSPAQRLANAASASCDSASDRNVASVSSRPCQGHPYGHGRTSHLAGSSPAR